MRVNHCFMLRVFWEAEMTPPKHGAQIPRKQVESPRVVGRFRGNRAGSGEILRGLQAEWRPLVGAVATPFAVAQLGGVVPAVTRAVPGRLHGGLNRVREAARPRR